MKNKVSVILIPILEDEENDSHRDSFLAET